jgi:hypothetical protein
MIDISDLDGEDLACAGLRRADSHDFFAEMRREAHAQIEVATECFRAAPFCPSWEEEGEEYLASAARLLEATGLNGAVEALSSFRPPQEVLAASSSNIAPPQRRRHRPRISVPDGLLSMSEAAAKLNCSVKTLNGHIESGALHYVNIGHGAKRVRKVFTDADVNEFITNQTRKDVPACPSSPTSARRTINTTSSSEVIAFTALPRPAPGAKPKR